MISAIADTKLGKGTTGDIKYRDVNGDGVINDGDQVAIGATSRPNLIYGLGASASWKGLDVNVHFQGAGKSTFFTYGKCVWAFTEGEWGNIFKGMLDNRWVDADTAETLGIPANENPNASYPRLSYQGDNASNNNYRTLLLVEKWSLPSTKTLMLVIHSPINC